MLTGDMIKKVAKFDAQLGEPGMPVPRDSLPASYYREMNARENQRKFERCKDGGHNYKYKIMSIKNNSTTGTVCCDNCTELYKKVLTQNEIDYFNKSKNVSH